MSDRLLGPGRRAKQRLEQKVLTAAGGRQRARVIALLAAVLAVSSADTSAVGADAAPLQHALHISFTEIGLLAAVPSLVSAAATVPIGALSDRVRRVSLLRWSVVLWSVAMIATGMSTSFEMLLICRLVIGGVTATSGPTLASLIGDFFSPQERGKIYGLILSGDLIGSVLGLFVSGNLATISWRLAFWVLVLPTTGLAWAIWRLLPEPARGGADRLAPHQDATSAAAQTSGPGKRDIGQIASGSDLQLGQLLTRAAVPPRPENLIGPDAHQMRLPAAVRYVLHIPTNLALVLASALGYFFISGVLTFGVLFIRHQYSVGQSVASSLLAMIAVGALTGILGSGRLADRLLRAGRIPARVIIAAASYLIACALFLPPLLSRSLIIGVPCLWLAAAALYASNPPLDAARLDVVPHWLWGRAEGVRTLLRSLTTAAAPLLFGFISDHLATGGQATQSSGQSVNSGGLADTFLIMLIPMVGAGLILAISGRRHYPRDVATAIASQTAAGRSAAASERRPA